MFSISLLITAIFLSLSLSQVQIETMNKHVSDNIVITEKNLQG